MAAEPPIIVPELRDYQQINAELVRRLNLGQRHVRLEGVEGQRLLVSRIAGPWQAVIEIEGNAGPELAAELNAPGLIVVCRGSAADGAGRGLVVGPTGHPPELRHRPGLLPGGGLIVACGDVGPRAGLNQKGGGLVLLGRSGCPDGRTADGGRLFLKPALTGPNLGFGSRGGRRIDLPVDDAIAGRARSGRPTRLLEEAIELVGAFPIHLVRASSTMGSRRATPDRRDSRSCRSRFWLLWRGVGRSWGPSGFPQPGSAESWSKAAAPWAEAGSSSFRSRPPWAEFARPGSRPTARSRPISVPIGKNLIRLVNCADPAPRRTASSSATIPPRRCGAMIPAQPEGPTLKIDLLEEAVRYQARRSRMAEEPLARGRRGSPAMSAGRSPEYQRETKSFLLRGLLAFQAPDHLPRQCRRRSTSTGPVDRLGEAIQERKGTLWVDLENPEGASMKEAEDLLRNVFGFHPLAVDDALQESHIPQDRRLGRVPLPGLPRNVDR